MKKLIDYPTLSTDAGTRAIRTDVDFDNTVGSFRLIPAPVVEAADAVVEAADIASRSQFNTPRHYCDIAKLKSALAAYEEATREPK